MLLIMRRSLFISTASKLLIPLLVLCVYVGMTTAIDHYFINRYPDGDQALVADMTRWFSAFTVKEPYFFGQAYLFPLGSYLAVPLVWLGVDPFISNEIVTAVCLFGPFFLVGTILYLRRNSLLALLCYAAPLLLPSTLLITGLEPRGLVEPIGIAAALIGLVGFGLIRSRWALILVFAVIGFCFGSVPTGIVLLPFAVGALIISERLRKAVLPAIAFIGGLAAAQAFTLYYKLHPALVVFPRNESVTFSWGQLTSNLNNPVIHQATMRILLVLLVPAVVVGILCLLGFVKVRFTTPRERIIALVVSVVSVLALLAVLGSTKLTDSMDTIYFTPDRLLIGFVFFPLGYFFWFQRTARPWNARLRSPLTVVATVLFLALSVVGGYQVSATAQTAEARVAAFRPVPVVEKSALEATCKTLQGLQETGHYLFLAEARSDLIAYGCHALYGVDVAQQNYDRRSWVVGLWQKDGFKQQTVQAQELSEIGLEEIPFLPPN
ncbi:MAG: hypothetical protein JWQ64_3755 [Subtercola sp.]|nr:hypothetical protein [Subtercola sp.]